MSYWHALLSVYNNKCSHSIKLEKETRGKSCDTLKRHFVYLKNLENEGSSLLFSALNTIKMEAPKTEMKLPNGPKNSVVPT